MTDEQKIHLNAIAKDFRDYADRDYIAARTLYRNECLDQFLFLSHQAVEKYLKSVLIYHHVKVSKGSHSLKSLLKLCKTISNFVLSLQSEIFIENINKYNAVRYPDFPFHGKREWLIILDSTVWELRFYTQHNYKKINHFVEDIGFDELYKKYRTRNKGNFLFGGYIEKVLENRNHKHDKQRSNLVWINLYYGYRTKKHIRFKDGFWSKNNHLFALSPQEQKKAYEAIKDYIYLPNEAHDYFKKL